MTIESIDEAFSELQAQFRFFIKLTGRQEAQNLLNRHGLEFLNQIKERSSEESMREAIKKLSDEIEAVITRSNEDTFTNAECNGPAVSQEFYTDYPDYDHPDSRGVPLNYLGEAIRDIVPLMFSEDIIELTVKINKGGKVTYRALHGGFVGNLEDLVCSKDDE